MLTHASRPASTQHFVAKATALRMTSFVFLLFLFTPVMGCGADGPVMAPASEKPSGENSAVTPVSPPTPPTPPAAGAPAPAEDPANADSGTTALQAEETQGDKATLELLR